MQNAKSKHFADNKPERFCGVLQAGLCHLDDRAPIIQLYISMLVTVSVPCSWASESVTGGL